MKAVEALVEPLVQGPPLLRESARETEVYPISSDDTSRAREVVDAEDADAAGQPALILDEGNSALVWVRPEPRGWDHLRVLWRSRDDPEGEPLFALEDAVEGGRWGTFEQYRQLAERSLRTALSVVADDLPRVAQVCIFLSRATLSFSGFVTINDPCSASPGDRDPIPWEVGLSLAGEGRLGPASAAGGTSRWRQ